MDRFSVPRVDTCLGLRAAYQIAREQYLHSDSDSEESFEIQEYIQNKLHDLEKKRVHEQIRNLQTCTTIHKLSSRIHAPCLIDALYYGGKIPLNINTSVLRKSLIISENITKRTICYNDGLEKSLKEIQRNLLKDRNLPDLKKELDDIHTYQNSRIIMTKEILENIQMGFNTLIKIQDLLVSLSVSMGEALKILSGTNSRKLRTLEKISNQIYEVICEGKWKQLSQLAVKYIGLVFLTSEIKAVVCLSRAEINIWRKLAVHHRTK